MRPMRVMTIYDVQVRRPVDHMRFIVLSMMDGGRGVLLDRGIVASEGRRKIFSRDLLVRRLSTRVPGSLPTLHSVKKKFSRPVPCTRCSSTTSVASKFVNNAKSPLMVMEQYPSLKSTKAEYATRNWTSWLL